MASIAAANISHAREPLAENETAKPEPRLLRISDGVSTSNSTRPKRLSRFQRLWDSWVDSWYPELLGCCLAGALLIAACVVLAVANNKPITWWPWDWQINSGLALITALMEACLLFPLTSCLGQLSWHSYRTGQEEPQRELIWFDRIAHAYTPLGAISFLSHMSAWR